MSEGPRSARKHVQKEEKGDGTGRGADNRASNITHNAYIFKGKDQENNATEESVGTWHPPHVRGIVSNASAPFGGVKSSGIGVEVSHATRLL